jgi:hypothetical protein
LPNSQALFFDIDRKWPGYTPPCPLLTLELGSNPRDDPEIRGGIWREAESFIGNLPEKEKAGEASRRSAADFYKNMLLEELA